MSPCWRNSVQCIKTLKSSSTPFSLCEGKQGDIVVHGALRCRCLQITRLSAAFEYSYGGGVGTTAEPPAPPFVSEPKGLASRALFAYEYSISNSATLFVLLLTAVNGLNVWQASMRPGYRGYKSIPVLRSFESGQADLASTCLFTLFNIPLPYQ